jgi:CBS domain-containing protein
VCSPDDTISDCADVVRSESISVLCVLDEYERVVGVLTRDAVLAASWLHRGTTVEDIMSTKLVFCEPEASTDEARRLLARTGAAIVLVAEDSQLVGWLAPHDLMNIRPFGTATLRNRL